MSNLTNAGIVNLTSRGHRARETPIVNDIIHLSFLELANQRQRELIQSAEHARLLSEVSGGQSPRIIRFARFHVGRVVVAMGRRIEGCSAKRQLEEVNASSALKLAR